MTDAQLEASGKLRLSSPKLMSRLSLMMFLQYFVQGAYLPIASVYVKNVLGFTNFQVGCFGAALAVGPVLAPFIVGQFVDRFFATERVMAVCHLAGGILMLLIAAQTAFWPVIVLGTLYSILYVPTMMLTNSLAFQHLKNSDIEFPWIRLFGTLGYIVPAYIIEFWFLRNLAEQEMEEARVVAFTISGVVGIVMAVYCLTLPHTPPEREKSNYAPGIVLRMLGNRDFLVLVLVSFLIAIAHNFIVIWFGPFMNDILGGKGAYEQTISSAGQICEILVLLGLGLLIKQLGFKRTMLLGITAYMVRCLLFAMVFYVDPPFWGKVSTAVLGQALHGFCFGCFMAVGYMYVDRIAPLDVRGSMQTLYGVFVIALGFFVGSILSGAVTDVFSGTIDGVDYSDWPSIWLSCAGICAICVVLFALFFPPGEPVRAKMDDTA
jgi:nucleoside transporter